MRRDWQARLGSERASYLAQGLLGFESLFPEETTLLQLQRFGTQNEYTAVLLPFSCHVAQINLTFLGMLCTKNDKENVLVFQALVCKNSKNTIMSRSLRHHSKQNLLQKPNFATILKTEGFGTIFLKLRTSFVLLKCLSRLEIS